ncbi:MAG: hypothetical protein I3273_06780 [Candidatus Moeniiplasma glomeromycotorum]|nr:hypothetical protein [Candidatus Moeniiplasma glomeromycotorum]MCE8168145.1 hypothetical protein [Candidatus Moeniiplasma glomeromycotorum]MCE8169790.1 hypothetical protein [Candidatus Moeniiplasma glomeromycotorum]
MTRKPKATYQVLTIKLPKEWVEHLLFLEKTTTKSKDYYVKEALFRYLEDFEDLEVGLKTLKSKSKTYTPEEANERLKELWAMKGITKSTPKNV